MKNNKLGVFFYNVFLGLFKAGIYLASLFNDKAKKWVRGRKDIFSRLEKAIGKNDRVIWMHCASLGEFEQGRPLWEKLKSDPSTAGYKFLVTFFSPSGYEIQKDYKGADWVFYLPADGSRNARRFLEIVHPSLAIFVKYEFWYYYLKKIKYRQIPLLLVSALFREDMSFFKWYGAMQRKMLSRFDHLFVQNEDSKRLVSRIGLEGICSISGDTRFDRVIEIRDKWEPLSLIASYLGNSKAIVAGSTWREDEEVWQKAFAGINDPDLRLIIAPHEIDEAHISAIRELFPDSVLFSQLSATQPPIKSPVLIIDNIGMLSRLYNYGYITFVGGAFRKMGVHNVLEAAVYGRPVIYGPYYKKYYEAIELVKCGGAIEVGNERELAGTVNELLQDENRYRVHCRQSLEYVGANKGATEKIIRYIQENRLLTS